MWNLIKRLFSTPTTVKENRPSSARDPVSDRFFAEEQQPASDAYFDTLSQMQVALSKRDYQATVQLVRQNLEQIPDWVKERRTSRHSFDIQSIPALQQGGTVLALMGDDNSLALMREIVASINELEPWRDEVERHHHDRRLFDAIIEAIGSHPNCLQTEVKGFVGNEDGRRIAKLISYLEKAGRIERIKAGRTYRLRLLGSAAVPKPKPSPPQRIVGSHRSHQSIPPINEIDISPLNYVPLPHAPLRWEEEQSRREKRTVVEAKGHFEIQDGDWRIESIEGIPPVERPDPAFRRMHPSDSGLVFIDDLGNANGLGQLEAAALRYDRSGKQVAIRGLSHGIYRVGVHPLGQGMIAMSQQCVLHAYDDFLNLFLETSLDKAPEIVKLRKRFEIPLDKLKNHVRCVALSRDMSRYLFTAVDEAWCIGVDGNGLWGTKLPLKEGWKRVATPSDNFGTSNEVDGALSLMGLSLPVTPQDTKRRYRELAKQWHPDVNPGDRQAQEKMKDLTLAMELLTGIDASVLARYTGTAVVQEIGRQEIEVEGMRFSVSLDYQVGEIHAADWIYAASFVADSDAVYLAGYSGRVILVDGNGNALRVYDIGSVPRRIVDTGDYLYLLTDTRLYVLRNDALHALVDTFDSGDLVVAQTGFGLLEKKLFRWFREDGRYVGSIVSKAPIRRVYSADDSMIVETRQRRAVVHGAPKWWE